VNGLQTYFDMDGYAGFVWPAYLAAALVLGALAVASVVRLRRLRRALALLENEAERPQ
jgi:heme exporter protein CcmD